MCLEQNHFSIPTSNTEVIKPHPPIHGLNCAELVPQLTSLPKHKLTAIYEQLSLLRKTVGISPNQLNILAATKLVLQIHHKTKL